MVSLTREDKTWCTECIVDIKNLSKAMNVIQIEPERIICCLVAETGIMLHCYVLDNRLSKYVKSETMGVVSYYIPLQQQD